MPERLGGVPASRVPMDPPPGTATADPAIAAGSRYGRLCELVDGTLAEKPAGCNESIIAMVILGALGEFVLPRR